MAKDLLTGEEFIPKKRTQKFANPGNRIKYNNRKASLEKQAVAYIDDQIKKNRRVLDELMKGKDDKVFEQAFLVGHGFSYNVITHIKIIDQQQHFALYYYLILNDNKAKTTNIIRYE
jgi:hypothetical protein